MNKIKEDIKEVKPKVERKSNFFFRYVRPLLDGSIFSQEKAEKNFPFIFYVILLIILFISNTFRAQDTQRQINHTKEEVKAMRIKSIYMKSLLMESTRPTKMTELVKGMGLEESEVPPRKIIIED